MFKVQDREFLLSCAMAFAGDQHLRERIYAAIKPEIDDVLARLEMEPLRIPGLDFPDKQPADHHDSEGT